MEKINEEPYDHSKHVHRKKGKGEPSISFNRPPPEKRIKAASPEPPITSVIIKDIQIPFWSMVTLTVKWAFALIPAGLLVAFGWMIIIGFLRELVK